MLRAVVTQMYMSAHPRTHKRTNRLRCGTAGGFNLLDIQIGTVQVQRPYSAAWRTAWGLHHVRVRLGRRGKRHWGPLMESRGRGGCGLRHRDWPVRRVGDGDDVDRFVVVTSAKISAGASLRTVHRLRGQCRANAGGANPGVTWVRLRALFVRNPIKEMRERFLNASKLEEDEGSGQKTQ